MQTKKLRNLVLLMILSVFLGCKGQAVAPSPTTTTADETVRSENGMALPYVEKISRAGYPKESLVLVSWNACNFGRSKSAETIAYMAKLLREADVVALQEVSTSEFGAQAVAKLSDELNRTGAKWDYLVSDATHESPGKERFAFLWRTSRIQAKPRKAILTAGLSGVLEREPAKVNFNIGDKAFTLASFHLVPTAKHPEEEARALSENPAEFSESNTILVGDFNLGHKRLDPFFENQLQFRHQIEGKTSLKAKTGQGGAYLAKEYDNIYIKGGLKIHQAAILDFVPAFDDLKQARQVSDHLPVFIIFSP